MNISIAVDIVIFAVYHNELCFLSIERKYDPFKGWRALPGGGVDEGESPFEAAERELLEETNLSTKDHNIFLEQLYTFGEPNRDPRGRVLSVAHFALVPSNFAANAKAADDALNEQWTPVGDLHKLQFAFDHQKIIEMAIERLRGRIDYDPRIAINLLPDVFLQSDLWRIHSFIKGFEDRSNFSKRFRRMVADGRLEQCEKKINGKRLFRFPKSKPSLPSKP